MSIELSAEAQEIAAGLPGAVTDLKATKRELETVGRDLEGLDQREADIQSGLSQAQEELEQDRIKYILGSYSRDQQSVIALVLGGEDQKLPENPDLETCQRIIELDLKLKSSAGQPVVVINPDKDWIDVGTLPHNEPGSMIEPKGLVVGRGHSRNRVEIGLHNVLAINPGTGTRPDSDMDRDGELFARENGFDKMHRPIVDPTSTIAILPGEDPKDCIEEHEEKTIVLIGHTHLRNILNDIFGFVTGDDDTENYRKFHAINMVVEDLGQKGTRFDDPDLIEGYLLYRISGFEREVEEDGLPHEQDAYRRQVLESLWNKYVELVEHGWLKAK